MADNMVDFPCLCSKGKLSFKHAAGAILETAWHTLSGVAECNVCGRKEIVVEGRGTVFTTTLQKGELKKSSESGLQKEDKAFLVQLNEVI